MFLPKLFSAASVALGKVPKALNLAPKRYLVLMRPVAPGILAPARRAVPALRAPNRNVFNVPGNQYENNVRPKRLNLGYALLHNWEIIPLFVVICFDIAVVLCGAIYTAIVHKVDTQFTKHNWNCISRQMDLRNPTIHKLLVLYQRYEPWPELQAVLDKMTQAEHRMQASLDQCGKP